MVFVKSRAIEGFVVDLGGDSLASFDWRLVALVGKIGYEVVFCDAMTVALMGKVGYEVVFGDTMTVK